MNEYTRISKYVPVTDPKMMIELEVHKNTNK